MKMFASQLESILADGRARGGGGGGGGAGGGPAAAAAIADAMARLTTAPLWKVVSLGALLFCLGTINGFEPDLVTNLPGQPEASFKHYAGFVTINPGSEERALFYWFFEADHPNSTSRPVGLWLQGGPGCSSIGSGALSEVGPFLIKNGSLVANKYSWNRELNLIFLDSPVGTGFSYTSDPSYAYADANTATDSYEFLLAWFKKFPKYSTNDFYLLGESYAGHYVPQLAWKILNENQKNNNLKLNLRGFNVGNPWTDTYSDNKGTLEWYLSHSLISRETYKLAIQNCNLSASYYIGDVGNSACKDAQQEIGGDLAEIVLENVYQDACNLENTTSIGSRLLRHFQLRARQRRLSPTWHHGQNPCAIDGVFYYLNDPKVQAALHVGEHVNWTSCSDQVTGQYNHADTVSSVLPVYRKFLEGDTKIRIWIYSGDWDGNVPTTGTRAWITSLELPILMKWRPWDYLSQVGGWTQEYDGLTFTTVRGAGHLVPMDQPGKALAELRSFLRGKPLPQFHLISD